MSPQRLNAQMFGPGVEQVLAAYRNAHQDPDLAALLALIGSTERIVHRFRRQGETVTGFDEKGQKILSVPVREPIQVLPAFDSRLRVVRGNVT